MLATPPQCAAGRGIYGWTTKLTNPTGLKLWTPGWRSPMRSFFFLMAASSLGPWLPCLPSNHQHWFLDTCKHPWNFADLFQRSFCQRLVFLPKEAEAQCPWDLGTGVNVIASVRSSGIFRSWKFKVRNRVQQIGALQRLFFFSLGVFWFTGIHYSGNWCQKQKPGSHVRH